MARRKHKTLKVGNQHYVLREEQPINEARYQKLKTHPQFSQFIFKKRIHAYWWYTKSNTSSNMTTTEKEQNQLLDVSGRKLLNKKDKIDNLTQW